MAGSSVTGIAVKLGAPLGLIVAGLWAVNRFVSPDLAKKIGIFVLIFIVVLIFVWLLVWLLRVIFRSISSAKERRRMAPPAAAQPGPSPQSQAELDGLQRNLDKALKVIREASLSRGRKSREALYVTPWILLLGPAGAGKTTALEESRVDFLYTTDKGRGSFKGAGDGCEYWISRDAVVLDLSGRIATQGEDSEVFAGFLDQLKRARKDRPLDAVVVTVSIKDLLTQPAEQVGMLAGLFRQRFDEISRRLGIRFAVYIVFTQCDQIDGFTDFFASFRSRDRAQVWGATISREQRRGGPIGEIFAAEFARLAASLDEYRLQAMGNEKDKSRLARIFTFPARFGSLGQRLKGFVDVMMQPTPYSERPMFRGFYLTSAAGAGVREERQEIAESEWNPGRLAAAQEHQPSHAKNYFLETLFPSVIFADRPLATLSVGTRLHRRLWLDVIFVTLLAVCFILLGGMTYSFLRNSTLIESTRTAALPLTDGGWNGKGASDLTALQQFRDRVAELDHFQTAGPRWSLRWGLYSGAELTEPSRHLYFRRLRQSFILPTFTLLHNKLYAFSTGAESASNYSQFYSYLKAYLMMSDPSRADPAYLDDVLAPLWKQLAPPEAERVALDQLRFYSQQLSKKDADFQVSPDANVVAVARQALGQYPVVNRLYVRLKDEGNSKFRPYTLAEATGGKSLEYLNSNYDVPGVFTQAAWSGFFKNEAERASKEAVGDDWVLGPVAGGQSAGAEGDRDYDQQLRQKYFEEYITEWQKFLAGISVRPLTDLTDARAALNSLSQQDSALSRLLINVASNTMLLSDPSKRANVSSVFDNVLASVGLSTRVNRQDLVAPVANEFQPLHDLVTSPDGKSPSLMAQYIAALGRVQIRLESLFGAGTQWDQVKAYVDSTATNLSSNEFQEAYRLAQVVNHQCTTNSTRAIGPLLEQPLRQTWIAILKDAGLHLDGLWRTQISEPFNRDIENGYPFNPSGRDVSLATVSQYFKPQDGTLDAFYGTELRMFLTKADNTFTPRMLMGAQVPFSPAFLQFLGRVSTIRQALFPPGSPDISLAFDLTPDSTPGVTESLLEIDGQRLRYRNEPPLPYSLTWPSKSGAPQARLSIALGETGERPATQPVEGEWALFRLLGQASVSAQSQTTYDVNFSLTGSDGRTHMVHYKLQARNLKNPFAANFFRGLVCPERITQIPSSPSLGN
jgi:type VI secretion system protein ImpL